ncbi:MAG: 16S rRNA (cytosine(1402)-N(4))-methyltransferase [Spirochaetota bacterium]|nr:16S rRNA (cytosine(1402)-N(4))-methyltransferase [Spirochaetota bacterium]
MRYINASSDRDFEYAHVPVMGKEVLCYIEGALGTGNNIFVDCTLGEGGHTELVLKNFEDIKVVAYERDADILKRAKNRLEEFEERIEYINDNFSNISTYFDKGDPNASVFLYDFGISSYHFERSGKGFAINKDELLDMSLDSKNRFNAYDIVNYFSEKELRDIIWNLGEERWAKRITEFICNSRKKKGLKQQKSLLN